MRRGPQHVLELQEPAVELNQLVTALSHQVLVEPVAPEHLEDEAPQVAKLLVAHLQQHAALAAQGAGGGERDARWPLTAESHGSNSYNWSTTTRSSVISLTAYAGPSRVVPESLTPP